jgi:hypothetical protein
MSRFPARKVRAEWKYRSYGPFARSKDAWQPAGSLTVGVLKASEGQDNVQSKRDGIIAKAHSGRVIAGPPRRAARAVRLRQIGVECSGWPANTPRNTTAGIRVTALDVPRSGGRVHFSPARTTGRSRPPNPLVFANRRTSSGGLRSRLPGSCRTASTRWYYANRQRHAVPSRVPPPPGLGACSEGRSGRINSCAQPPGGPARTYRRGSAHHQSHIAWSHGTRDYVLGPPNRRVHQHLQLSGCWPDLSSTCRLSLRPLRTPLHALYRGD